MRQDREKTPRRAGTADVHDSTESRQMFQQSMKRAEQPAGETTEVRKGAKSRTALNSRRR